MGHPTYCSYTNAASLNIIEFVEKETAVEYRCCYGSVALIHQKQII